MKQFGKKSVALILVLMMTCLCIPAGVYAGSSGGNIIKSIDITGCAGAKVKLSGSDGIQVTVPYSYAGETLDLNGKLSPEWNSAVGNYPVATFPEDSEAEVDGAPILYKVDYQKPQAAEEGGEPEMDSAEYFVSVVRAEKVNPTFKGTVEVELNLSGTSSHTFKQTEFTDKYTQNDGNAMGGILITGSNTASGKLFLGSEELDCSGGVEVSLSDIAKLKATADDAGTNNFTVKAIEAETGEEIGSGYIRITTENEKTLSAISAGTIDKNQSLEIPADKMKSVFKSAIGLELASVKFEKPAKGSLSDANGTLDYSKSVPVDELGTITYVPGSGTEGSVTIKYSATDADKSCTGAGTITLTVNAGNMSTISLTVDTGDAEFIDSANIASKYKSATGKTLSYIKFTKLPDSAYGILYYNYVSPSSKGTKVATSTKLNNSSTSPKLSTAAYYATSKTGSTTATFEAYDSSNNKVTGEIKFTNRKSDADISTISISVASDETVKLKAKDFYDTFEDSVGEKLDYIEFEDLPTTSQGTLYLGYTSSGSYDAKVKDDGTNYYYSGSGKKLIGDITFVPKSSYSGTITLNYTAYDHEDGDYSGKLKITVTSGAASGDIKVITYELESGDTKKLSATDINTEFKKLDAGSFDYLKFELPASSKGTLYYNYKSSSSTGTAVKATDKYYRTGSDKKLVNDVTLAVKNSYTGTFYINYEAFDGDGESYEGQIKIVVGEEEAGDIKTITYSIEKDKTKTLSGTDINTQFKKVSDYSFEYVKFELPSSTKGTLYCNYKSSTNTGTAVKASDKYTRTGSKTVDDVTFVPKKGFEGTVSINYTAYDEDGESYEGIIKIEVGAGEEGDIATLSYTITAKQTLKISSTDINTKFKKAADNESFDYLKFKLPSSSTGKLYYKYNTTSKTGTAVSASDKYYRTGSSKKLVSDITFVPNSNYSGTFNLEYTAYDEEGESYDGIIKITVQGVTTFTDVKSTDYFADAVDWAVEKGITTGTSSTTFSPSKKCTRAEVVTFLWRAAGSPSVGSVSNKFTDVSSGKYYYNAVMWAVSKGITKGTTTTTFSPDATVDRGQVVTFIYRFAGASYNPAKKSFKDVAASQYYYAPVEWAVARGITKGTATGTFSPTAGCTRAEIVTFLYRYFN